MGVRRKGRELSVQTLYRMELTGDRSLEGMTKLWEQIDTSESQRRVAAEIVRGILEHEETIDATVASSLEHWSAGRLSNVDRNVLRVAVWELLYRSDAPAAVVLNEAIEIARRFGGEDSARFVNGVLDRIARETRSGERAKPPSS